MTIDLIIPVYQPDKRFLEMVEIMCEQTLPINKIIIMNVEQKYFDRLVYSKKFMDQHRNLEVRHSSKKEYDHGKTRNSGVKLSDADYFMVMNQNTLPSGHEVVQKLYDALKADPTVAVAYARHISMESVKEYEKFVRRYYYSEDSSVRSLKDADTLGWQAFMNSNVCAMYDRKKFDELGGFLNHVIANEDILFASKALHEGYKIAYVADAVTLVTEEFSEKEQEKMAFDAAVSMMKHPETFNIEEIKDEHKKLDKLVINHLRRSGYRSEVMEFKRLARAKKRGFARGLKYKKISLYDTPKYSANPEYWRMDEILRDRNSIDVHSGYGRSEQEMDMLKNPPVRARKRETEE